MVLGAAGNVGAYAVQFATHAGIHVIAVVGSKHVAYVRALGATEVIDSRVTDFAGVPHTVDAVIDLVGGDTRDRATSVLKPGGILVTVVSTDFIAARADVRTVFFYAEVTTARLSTISALLDSGTVVPQVGSVLPLEQTRAAHEMLAGAPHERGKIVLNVGG